MYLLIGDVDDAEYDIIETEISLAALTGISTARTMKLVVRIAGVTLTALVDTGSTHTFINDAVAHRLALNITPQPGLSVRVANGDRVISAGICDNTNIAIGKE